MLVGVVGRFVMKGCEGGIPATTTEVDVLISVVVLACETCGGGPVLNDTNPGGIVNTVSLAAGVVDIVGVADPRPGRNGVTRLLNPLMPSHMMS